MGTALRNTKPDSAAPKNTMFPARRPFALEGVDIEPHLLVDHLESSPSLPRWRVLGRSQSLLIPTLAVLFVLLTSGRALAQDGSSADSDGDGLSDTAELSVFGTDPQAADSDGDGLPDGVEVELGTNPLLADSDGDGFNDSSEYLAGSDPLLRTDTPYGMVVAEVPDGSTSDVPEPVVGVTPVTVSPELDGESKSLAFDDSQGGRSALFPLFVSLAAAAAVGMAFLLALIPEAGSITRDS